MDKELKELKARVAKLEKALKTAEIAIKILSGELGIRKPIR